MHFGTRGGTVPGAVATGRRRDTRRYGTGSGSDRAPSKAHSPQAPGRYRSRYCTVVYTNVGCSDLAPSLNKLDILIACSFLSLTYRPIIIFSGAFLEPGASPIIVGLGAS